ncbi:hypothetical protein ILYODFUR_014368 [Ilyodon furcidens]|uniref:Uncharacterized protein n=1 Tax=Ilyodon furcidens TaxID=33524 RepID=A0ABV0UU73_9TELE
MRMKKSCFLQTFLIFIIKICSQRHILISVVAYLHISERIKYKEKTDVIENSQHNLVFSKTFQRRIKKLRCSLEMQYWSSQCDIWYVGQSLPLQQDEEKLKHSLSGRIRIHTCILNTYSLQAVKENNSPALLLI